MTENLHQEYQEQDSLDWAGGIKQDISVLKAFFSTTEALERLAAARILVQRQFYIILEYLTPFFPFFL